MTVATTPTQRKSRGYLILDQKLAKNKKVSKDIAFTSDNLQSILYKNKPKLVPISHLGVYQ